MGFGLGSIASAVGGFMTSGTGSALTSAYVNNYFNKKAAKKQFSYTKSLIDYENEYNSPTNQRARLEEAGYNPNLALNGVNVQSATGSAPTVQPTKLDLLSAYNLEAQYDLLKEQQKLTKTTAAKNSADVDKIDEQTETERLRNAKLRKDLKFYEETGIDPDSWQGNAFKPIWNTSQKVHDWAIRNLETPDNDYFWNLRMKRAREEYNRRFRKK